MTGRFVVVEGADGSGKSHLVRRLAEHAARGAYGIRPILKDDIARDGWGARRLSDMHALTWEYDRDEPVWEYPSEYWLYTLTAWYSLFFAERVAPVLADGATAVLDGWYFKHLARFRLTEEPSFVATAATVFATLPQPDAVLVAEADESELRARPKLAKPSEMGAFGTGGTMTFAEFQTRTSDAVVNLLAERGLTIRHVRSDARVEDLVEAVRAIAAVR